MNRLSGQALIALFCLLVVLASCGQTAQVEGRSPRSSQLGVACPKHPLSARGLARLNRNPKAATKTVPGDPDRLLLCRYSGVDQGKDLPEVAAKRRVSRMAVVQSLAGQFNRQPPYPKGVRSCPTGNGGPTYAFFRYEDQLSAVVEVWRDGCKRLSNGHARTRALTPQLEKRLLRLLPLPESQNLTASAARLRTSLTPSPCTSCTTTSPVLTKR
jgi:hypothetical protein